MLTLSGAIAILAIPAILTPLVLGHPGEKISVEDALWQADVRHAIADINTDALMRCDNQPHSRERKERAMARRMATFNKLRAQNGVSNGKKFTYLCPREPRAHWL